MRASVKRAFDPSRSVSRAIGAIGRKIWDDTPPLGAPHGSFARARLSDFLPYRHWDPVHELYEQEKTVGFLLEIIPLIGGDETTARILSELFNDAIPPGACCQVISWGSPKIGYVVDRWAKARGEGGAVYRELAAHRREHFRASAFTSASRSSPFYMRDFRVFISVEMAGLVDGVAAQRLVAVREKFVASLATIHTACDVVKPGDLVSLVQDLLNPTQTIASAPARYDPDVYLCEQMIRPDTTFTQYREKIVIRARGLGDGYEDGAVARELAARDDLFEVRGLSVHEYPEDFTQGMMTRALGDLFNDQLRLVGSTVMALVFSPWDAAGPARRRSSSG